MSKTRSGWFPVGGCDDFGYYVPLHSWTLNGESISDEEASQIYDERMAQRRELAQRDERPTDVEVSNERQG